MNVSSPSMEININQQRNICPKLLDATLQYQRVSNGTKYKDKRPLANAQ